MKKLYSKFVESRVREYISSHEPAAPRALSVVRPEHVLWQPIVVRSAAAAHPSLWVE
ncbi:MAG: hypothetical protein PW734_02535 [Verrucomicrobium sp.]|nr:hypothetical protein [Verrucomicrobium sp.]